MNICPDCCFVIAGLKADLLEDTKIPKEDLVTKEEVKIVEKETH